MANFCPKFYTFSLQVILFLPLWIKLRIHKVPENGHNLDPAILFTYQEIYLKLIFRPTTNLHVLQSNQLQIGVFHHWEVFGSVNKNAAAYFVRYPVFWPAGNRYRIYKCRITRPNIRPADYLVDPYAVPVPSKKKLNKNIVGE